MPLTKNHLFCHCKFLFSLTQSNNFLNVRYYPRWRHRRPVRIIENDITEEEKRLWKLGVEREINSPKPSATVSDSYANNVSKRVINYEKEKPFAPTHDNCKLSLKYSPTPKNIGDSHEVNDIGLIASQLKYKAKEIKLESTHKFKKPQATDSFQSKSRQNKTLSCNDQKQEEKIKKAAAKLGVPVFSDLGTNDKILSAYMTNVKSQKRREKIGKILLEGKRLIKDAVDAGIIPEAVFFSRMSDLQYINLPTTGVKIYKITYKEICLWSDVVTPQGVIAIVNIPDVSKIKMPSLPLTVVCDNVRDPGNMGTILRTCAGIGCQQVILMKGCVDLWEPKVLRAAAGAHFRMAIQKDLNWEDVVKQLPDNCCTFVAENNTFNSIDDGQNHSSADTTEESLIATEKPSNDDMHSNTDPPLQRNCVSLPPVIPYYSYNYTSVSSIALIIGGETEGVSLEAYEHVSRTGGARLNIPLSNEIESLNVNTALGIIGFEIKKQLFLYLCENSETQRIISNKN